MHGFGPRLSDKVALISGIGSGQGRAAALLFARHGAKVVGCDLNRERAEEVAQEAVLVLAADDAALAQARALGERRFPGPGWGLHEGGYIGTPDQVIERIRENIERGITLFVFFTHDRASRETLELFAERVMPAFR